MPRFSRRGLFACLGAGLLSKFAGGQKVEPLVSHLPDTSDLKKAAERAHIALGVFTGMHALKYQLTDQAIIDKTFSMIGVGNDLKFSNRLRPAPTTYDFSDGDYDVQWAESHHKLFRGHCLVWWNALPKWFQGYTNRDNGLQLMRDHIRSVMGHYRGRVYSWDVVNEPIYNDSPDGVRRKPWRELVGDDYIQRAFHFAHEVDPKARLLINECYIEHATEKENQRRGQYLALIKRLKREGVPIHGAGVQCHLRGAVELGRDGLKHFAEEVRGLGLELLATELDVDNVNVPVEDIDRTTAQKYSEIIDILGPYVNVITLETLSDIPISVGGPPEISRADIFDSEYRPVPAYRALVDSLNRLGERKHT